MVTSRVEKLRQWADFLPALMTYLNTLGVQSQAERALAARMPEIERLLDLADEAGVLVSVNIEGRYQGEIPFYQLQNNGVSLLGAGGTPEEIVAFDIAYGERHGTLRPGTTEGFRDAPGQSFYFWIQRIDDGYKLQTLDWRATTNAGRRLFAEQAMFEQSRMITKGRLLHNVARNLQREIEEEEIRLSIDQLLASREAALTRVQEIDTELKRELDKAAKANRAASFFSTMSQIFGFAESLIKISEILGNDTPADFINARDAEEARSILNGLADSAGTRADMLRLDMLRLYDAEGNISDELIHIFRGKDVPVNMLPGLVAPPQR